jgi:deoxyribonucleoside regulator
MNEIERIKFIQKIARLYYMEDMNQDEIADKFNIHRVQVSRYLQKAKKLNIVEIKVNVMKEGHQDLEREIEKKFGVKECIVVPSHENLTEILRDMASSLVGIFERLLNDGDLLGVNWGFTLKGVASLMKTGKKIKIKVIPICGGIGKIDTDIHTNFIAKQIAEVFGGSSYVINSPAIVDSKKVKDMLLNESSNKEYFDLLKHLNCLLFSFSNIDPDASHVRYGVIKEEEAAYLKSLGVIGDVNLDFIDKNGQHVPNDVFDRVIALPISEIKKIRTVIGIAVGNRKKEIVKALLKGQIVNILIIDRQIADHLIADD